jgi:heat shock protein HslJ
VRHAGKPMEQQGEPHLILQPAQKRVVGSGGCNRLAGSYTLDGDRVSFGRAAVTKMACLHGMEQESMFLDAPSAVTRWHVDGQRLDLLDERGEVIAQFESRYLQ